MLFVKEDTSDIDFRCIVFNACLSILQVICHSMQFSLTSGCGTYITWQLKSRFGSVYLQRNFIMLCTCVLFVVLNCQVCVD